jgi:hypothetical protein
MNELERIFDLLHLLKKNDENWNELLIGSMEGFKSKYRFIPPKVSLYDLGLSKAKSDLDDYNFKLKNQIKEIYLEFVMSRLKEINILKRALKSHNIDFPAIDLNVLFDTQDYYPNRKSEFSVVSHFLSGKYPNFQNFVFQVTTQEEYFSEEEIINKYPQGVFENFPYQSLLNRAKWILNNFSVLNGNRLTCIGQGIRAKIQLELVENHEMQHSEKWLIQLIRNFVFAEDIEAQIQLLSKKNTLESNRKLIKEVQSRFQ